MPSNAEIARAVMGHMSAGAFEQAASFLHDDVIVDCPFQAFHQGPLRRGKATVAAGFAFIPMVFSRFEVVVDELHDCPGQETVVLEMHSEGVFAAGGGSYRNRYVLVFGFRDGKIVLWRECFDPDVMNRGMAFLMDYS
ncbi:MAG TPA: nuclear transport factor 2 family protein [Nevskiaceae bacterium]|nr:nuclear transport factor 2 family protein [Nevskiaceae bacterium]